LILFSEEVRIIICPKLVSSKEKKEKEHMVLERE